MPSDQYPGIRLKQRLAAAGLLDQFHEAVRAKSYPKMKELINRVATSQDEAQHFIGVVFANPEHYDTVISDLHYNGETVTERLATEGLLNDFTTAVKAKDATQMVGVLEQAAITKTWAARLATMILNGPPQPPIRLGLDDPRNAGVHHARNDLKFPPCIRPAECPRDPYMYLGSHPDIVKRVWDQLGSGLPQDCRCIVFGTPGIVAPRSGILITKAFGTVYILRIPRDAVAEAVQAGAKTTMTWGPGRVTDLSQEYGDDWIFGQWLKQEPDWLLAVFNSVEGVKARHRHLFSGSRCIHHLRSQYALALPDIIIEEDHGGATLQERQGLVQGWHPGRHDQEDHVAGGREHAAEAA